MIGHIRQAANQMFMLERWPCARRGTRPPPDTL